MFQTIEQITFALDSSSFFFMTDIIRQFEINLGAKIIPTEYFSVLLIITPDFKEYSVLKRKLDQLLIRKITPIKLLVFGNDNFGKVYAEEKGYIIKSYSTETQDKKKNKRNIKMLSDSDAVVVFSRKDLSTVSPIIKLAKTKKKPIRIVKDI